MKQKKETPKYADARRDLAKEQLEIAKAKEEIAKGGVIGMAVGFVFLALIMLVMPFVF